MGPYDSNLTLSQKHFDCFTSLASPAVHVLSQAATFDVFKGYLRDLSIKRFRKEEGIYLGLLQTR